MIGFGATIVRHPVPGQLHGLVAGIVGYDEIAPPGGLVRVQPAGSLLMLEISFTTPLHVRELHADAGTEMAHGAFLAGLMPGPVRTVFFDRHASVQIYLTPLGAYRLLGVPGRETAGHVTPLADLVPRWGRDLPDRLAGAPEWHRRFTIVVDELIQQAGYGPAADDLTEWTWAELQRTGGNVRIAALAQSSGWSVRHLSQRFGDVTGISPKGAAQVIRFERVHADLETESLGDLAARHGLSDQSHLSREVRRYAGESPLVLALARRPTAFTAIGTHP
ncbi:helix-turn-helix transcriptional regulator [Paenarthrobacter sp. PH39-S1]|uniref:helix-turn-helix transcriptional regulator n=1 Tax=Paenarthrobacter sp. PH39-S1 TaxID=3046204 RepID=UPI0024BA382A|nr:helix-turn-helix transcriptional regulator [Paenarthrobacter sp. PH39-S1]MDJ0356691.1 helix-turn-helix transcriptional regulator [Paenarthrobacter sp. PH39-S1]